MREQLSRSLLIWLPLVFGVYLIEIDLLNAVTTFAYMSQWVQEFITVIPFAGGTYLIVLAIRSSWLPAQRLRGAGRNLILLVILCIVGVTVVEFTSEYHRYFWQQHFQSLVRYLR